MIIKKGRGRRKRTRATKVRDCISKEKNNPNLSVLETNPNNR